MNCPACGTALGEMTAGDITVDVCQGGCGGIWFDHLELQKLDDQEEAAGEALLDIPRDPAVRVDPDAVRACPRCGHPAMSRHFYSPRARVVVDECNRCEGIWLDAGELAAIRREYAGGDARQAATRAFLDDLAAHERAEIVAKYGPPKPAPKLPGAAPAGAVPPGPAPLSFMHRLTRFLNLAD